LLDEIECNRNVRDFGKSTLFIRNVINIVSAHFSADRCKSLVQPSEESNVYEKALLILYDLTDVFTILRVTVKSMNGTDFENLARLGSFLVLESNYHHQEILLDILIHVLALYRGQPDFTAKYEIMLKYLPPAVVESLRDPKNECKHILENLRPLLEKVNLSNPLIKNCKFEHIALGDVKDFTGQPKVDGYIDFCKDLILVFFGKGDNTPINILYSDLAKAHFVQDPKTGRIVALNLRLDCDFPDKIANILKVDSAGNCQFSISLDEYDKGPRAVKGFLSNGLARAQVSKVCLQRWPFLCDLYCCHVAL